MATLGLAFLLFLGGLEIDFAHLRGDLLRVTATGYAISLSIAVAVRTRATRRRGVLQRHRQRPSARPARAGQHP